MHHVTCPHSFTFRDAWNPVDTHRTSFSGLHQSRGMLDSSACTRPLHVDMKGVLGTATLAMAPKHLNTN